MLTSNQIRQINNQLNALQYFSLLFQIDLKKSGLHLSVLCTQIVAPDQMPSVVVFLCVCLFFLYSLSVYSLPQLPMLGEKFPPLFTLGEAVELCQRIQ